MLFNLVEKGGGQKNLHVPRNMDTVPGYEGVTFRSGIRRGNTHKIVSVNMMYLR